MDDYIIRLLVLTGLTVGGMVLYLVLMRFMTPKIPNDAGDDDHDFCEPYEDRCEMCDAEIIPYENDRVDCSVCYMTGCHTCMSRGDDVFPWTCGDHCGGPPL